MSSVGDSNVEIVEEELVQRHKHERKELQSRIQSLKKSIPKGDKKKKKEIADEVAKLEQEFEERIKEELNQLRGTKAIESVECISEKVEEPPQIEENDLESDDVLGPTSETTRVSRAQRRRNKKANDEKERDKRISEQSERNKKGARMTELNQIREKLKSMKLKLFNIEADGNCLFCAIIHQLEQKGREFFEVSDLRKTTAQFMRDNKDEFLPFMYNEMDESATINEEHFESYCKEVATTKLWGGQLELRALSNIFTCPIKIIQASGPPTVQGESFQGPELIITYHRHLYRLGEHYNSTVPDESVTDDD